MNRRFRNFAAATFLVGAVLLSGCRSASYDFPKLEPQPTFSHTGKRIDFEIRVQISPVEHKPNWYKMESALIEKQAPVPDQVAGTHGLDQLALPALEAAVGADAVTGHFPGTEPGVGPQARFKVYEQEGKVIAEYEIGYTSKEGDALTRKGHLVLKLSATD